MSPDSINKQTIWWKLIHVGFNAIFFHQLYSPHITVSKFLSILEVLVCIRQQLGQSLQHLSSECMTWERYQSNVVCENMYRGTIVCTPQEFPLNRLHPIQDHEEHFHSNCVSLSNGIMNIYRWKIIKHKDCSNQLKCFISKKKKKVIKVYGFKNKKLMK